jgi:DNA-binding transcriptional LysR family regulator
MTLQQLIYMIKIVEYGSINKAAQKLFVSQSSISHAVRKLEDELSITIFERTNNGVELTIEGIEFLHYANQLVEQASMLENYYMKKKIKDYTELSISTQHYAFAVDAFIKFLKHNERSRYNLFLRESPTYDIIKDVHNKRSALGIMFLSYRTERFLRQILDYNNIEFNELKRMKPHIFIRKDHPLTHKEKVTLDDLSDFPCISFEQGISNSLDFAEEILVDGTPEKMIYVQDRGTMNNIIANTDGYNIGTGYLLPGIIDSQITAIPLEGIEDEIIIGWIKLKNVELIDEVKIFVDYIKDSINI